MTEPTLQTGFPATTSAQNRIAGAPISWGVCEVPNWGYQLTPDQTLDFLLARELWQLAQSWLPK